MLFLPPKIIVVNRDLRISQCLLIYCWRKLLICWSIGTDSLVIFLKKLPIAINEKLWISHFPLACLVKRDMADVHSVSGVLYNLSSLFEFRPDWTPSKTHGKQNAPSRNLEYASQENLFSQPLTKWRLEFEHSTDTEKSIAYPVSNTFSVNLSLSWSEYELISLKTKPISYWEQFSFGKTGSPRTMVYRSNYSCLSVAS